MRKVQKQKVEEGGINPREKEKKRMKWAGRRKEKKKVKKREKKGSERKKGRKRKGQGG